MGEKKQTSRLSLRLRPGKGNREEPTSFYSPLSLGLRNPECVAYENIWPLPSEFWSVCCLMTDSCWPAFVLVRPGQTRWCLLGRGSSRLVRAELLRERAPEVQQRLDRQSRTPSLVWHTKHCHVSPGSRLAHPGGQPGSQTAGLSPLQWLKWMCFFPWSKTLQ